MNDPALAAATYWAPFLTTVADIAFAIVIVALAVELVSGRIAKRFERQIEQPNELKISELNNETARLEAQVSPRDITPDERNAIGAALSQFAGRQVTVQSFSMDVEAIRLGYEIILALDKAGIQTFDNRGSIMVAGPLLRFGIEVSNPGTPDGQQFGLGIAAAIATGTNGKIAVRHLAIAHTPNVVIFVGVKPIAGVQQ